MMPLKSIVLGCLIWSQSSWSLDPNAPDLALEREPAKWRLVRATQSSRSDFEGHFAFGLGLSWNPELLSRSHHRFSADLGFDLVSDSNPVASQGPKSKFPPHVASHIRLIYERRFNEALSLEVGPGMVFWSALGNFESPYSRGAFRYGRGWSATIRMVDHFLPPINKLVDRWSIGLNFDFASDGVFISQLAIASGFRF